MIMHNAPHPGEILREWMGEDISVTQLAAHIGLTRVTLSRLLNGASGVSASMALRLSEAFPKTSPEYWLKLQLHYDLSQATMEKRKPVAPVRAA